MKPDKEEEEEVEEIALKKQEMSVEMVDKNPYNILMALKNFKTF